MTSLGHWRCDVPVNPESKGVDRRLLLLSAWTIPVVASFALGGLATAGERIWGGVGNASLGLNAMSKTSNAAIGAPVKTAIPKPK